MRRRVEIPREEPMHREPVHPSGPPAGAAWGARIEPADDGEGVPREDPMHREEPAVVRRRTADRKPGMAEAHRARADDRSEVTRLIMEMAMRAPPGGMPAGLGERAHAP